MIQDSHARKCPFKFDVWGHLLPHDHGVECHETCPTCHGKPVEKEESCSS